ncbi:hypothetical protein [Paenibacillus macquariensis]|uniref:Uncharacterized protein n=1 Tax=Paenibacillus macquariensis TaxID=948756 RepID=A0ABY1K1F6_9BACL|nr:hypothetical protein [Paenibacillus macquariensis]MEC0091802.1 hypothetical protein [Paenibacillus macquariensis]OAB32286.1 hypothetical protein PMSM_16895 [Paenibacillus macquariensis subsp. macquariensis]SIR11691.1 hypothetical protein SAMN05421578_107113 [Paenibacillus macquariensis]
MNNESLNELKIEEVSQERVHIAFKFENANIKYPMDKFDGGDLFRTIIELKDNGGTLENDGKTYDLSELKEMVVSFENVEIKGDDK